MENITEILETLHSSNVATQKDSLDKILLLINAEGSLLNIHLLKNNIDDLETVYKRLKESDNKRTLADIISFLCVTDNNTILYRKRGGIVPVKQFGFLYAKEMLIKMLEGEFVENIFMECINEIFNNFSEIDGIDFCLEYKRQELILELTNDSNYKKVIGYLEELNKYLNVEQLLYKIYEKMGDKIRCIYALLNKINSRGKSHEKLITEEIAKTIEESTQQQKLQIAFILNRSKYYNNLLTGDLKNINIGRKNVDLIKHAIKDFEIDLKEEEFNLSDIKMTEVKMTEIKTLEDSLRNFGLQNKKILSPLNFGQLKTSIFSTLTRFDDCELFGEIQESLFSDDLHEKTGAACALAFNSNFYDEEHVCLAVFSDIFNSIEFNNKESEEIFMHCMLGIESLYRCSNSKTARKLCLDLINSEKMEKATSSFYASFTCFTLGSVCAGSYDNEIITTIFAQITNSDKKDYAKLMPLGLALCLISDAEDAQNLKTKKEMLENFEALEEGFVLCKALMNRNSKTVSDFGGFLDQFMEEDGEENSVSDENDETPFSDKKCFSIFCAALISRDDAFISNLNARISNSFVMLDRFESSIPICLGLAYIYASNPQQLAVDTLIMFGNQGEKDLSIAAIISVAIVGAGTKNAQIVDFLEDQKIIFNELETFVNIINISISLVNLGRGTFGIYKSIFNNKVENIKSNVGLISFLYSVLALKPRVLEENLSLLLLLVKSFFSKIVHVVDTKLEILSEEVKVGIPVDTIGLAGDVVEIVAEQVYNSPVVVQKSEKAQLSGVEVEIEGVVVVVESN